MTVNSAPAMGTGASLASGQMWEQANWPQIEAEVKRLQMRIAKAVRESRWGKVKALQRLLTRAYMKTPRPGHTPLRPVVPRPR